jgi:peptidyl-prolyl cis-trans isomerase SurA
MRRLALPAVLALACAIAPAPAGAAPRLADRIVAVVNGDPILQSDVERTLALGLVERRADETPQQLRRRVLDGLVEQRLRVHEVERYGFEQVPVEMIAEQIDAIRARFPSEEAFRRRLADLGLQLAGLEQLVAQQLQVMVYVDELLGARVFVGVEEIEAHYERVLAPRLRREGRPVPPIEEVREEIREVLRQERLNEELARWTAELRREADVRDHLDAPVDVTQRPLPAKFGERPPAAQ